MKDVLQNFLVRIAKNAANARTMQAAILRVDVAPANRAGEVHTVIKSVIMVFLETGVKRFASVQKEAPVIMLLDSAFVLRVIPL